MTARQAMIKALEIAENNLKLPHNEATKTEDACKKLASELGRRRLSLEATEKREAKKKSLQKA